MTITAPRRTIGALAAGVALALAGCGEDPARDAGGGAGANRASAAEGALAFARCMREHGIDLPDPQTSGGGMVRITPGEGFDPGDPRARRAQEACRDELPAAGPEDLPADERRELRERALRFTQCLREQGLDAPDPDADGGLRIGPGQGIDPQDPRFRRAEAACRDRAPVPVPGPATGDGEGGR